MKTSKTNHLLQMLSNQTFRRLMCSAVTVASVFLGAAKTQAQIGPAVTNYFEGTSDVNGFDSYPGAAQGWSQPWKLSTSSSMTAGVISDSPLNGSNSYLNVVIANLANRAAASRTYTTFVSGDAVNNPDYDSYSLNYMPHKISFDFRVDNFETNGVPYDWTLDNSSSDTAFISGMASQSQSKPSTSSSWLIQVFGASPSLSTPSAPAGTWVYIDGSAVTNTSNAAHYVNSGMPFHFNVVYHFDVITDPLDKLYKVTASDGTNTTVSPWLKWFGFPDPNQFSSEDNITFGGGMAFTNCSISLSIDSIIVQQMTPAEFPPRITELSPYYWGTTTTNVANLLGYVPQLNTPICYPASKGLSFVASTGGGGSNDMQNFTGPTDSLIDQSTNVLAYRLLVANTTIPASGIGLVLNGSNVSSGLTMSGKPNFLHVSYNNLAPNTVYKGTIFVTNSAGGYISRDIAFDTFDEASAKLIEAEDYNFGNGSEVRGGAETDSTVGGLFLDNAAPSDFINGAYINQVNGYVDKVGDQQSVDYFNPSVTNDQFSAGLNVYRAADGIQTSFANDYARPKHLLSGTRDYIVTNVVQNEWMNYTRTFAPGNYTAYLRAASTVNSSSTVSLDLLTSDPTQPGQTLTNLGTFQVSYTGVNNVFTNAALIVNPTLVSNGIPIFLSGQQTLRLTAVNNTKGALSYNYLVLVPDSTNLPSVTITSPASGASFAAGSNITLTASASTGVSKVEYFNAGASLGSSTASPFSVTWSGVATGKYSVTAKATGAVGFSASSAPVNITVGSPAKRVLLVVDANSESAALNTGDQFLVNLITSKGWTYNLIYANVSTPNAGMVEIVGPEAANGFDLVIIGGASGSGSVNDTYRDVPVPFINFNQAEQGGRTGLTKELQNFADDYGIAGGQQIVTVVAVGDPGAAGYSGIQSLFINPQAAAIGYPNANAVIIVKNTNAPAIFANAYYYKAGAEMCQSVIAPAVRYQAFDGSPTQMGTNLTAFGSNILSAALDIAVANPAFVGNAPLAGGLTLSGGHVTIPFKGLSTDLPGRYTLQGAASVTGPYTTDNAAVITGPVGTQFQAVTTAPTNSQYFYRVVRQ